MCDISLEREFNYMLLWYIANADWFIRTSTTDVCVTLPPIFRQPREYSHIDGKKNVAQTCRLGNKTEYVHRSIGVMNRSKNITLLTISKFLYMDGNWTTCLYGEHREGLTDGKQVRWVNMVNEDHLVLLNNQLWA